MNKAVILDRDGTINVDKGYVYKIEDFEFIPGVIESIKKLNDNGYKVIVITNQSGIGRGYFETEDVYRLHEHINSELSKHDAYIDAFYFCPHKPGDLCYCRKPRAGMYHRAIEDFDIDKKSMFLIGDKERDIVSAKLFECKYYLLNNGITLKKAVDKIVGGKNE